MVKNDANMTCQLLNFEIKNQLLNFCVGSEIFTKWLIINFNIKRLSIGCPNYFLLEKLSMNARWLRCRTRAKSFFKLLDFSVDFTKWIFLNAQIKDISIFYICIEELKLKKQILDQYQDWKWIILNAKSNIFKNLWVTKH